MSDDRFGAFFLALGFMLSGACLAWGSVGDKPWMVAVGIVCTAMNMLTLSRRSDW